MENNITDQETSAHHSEEKLVSSGSIEGEPAAVTNSKPRFFMRAWSTVEKEDSASPALDSHPHASAELTTIVDEKPVSPADPVAASAETDAHPILQPDPPLGDASSNQQPASLAAELLARPPQSSDTLAGALILNKNAGEAVPAPTVASPLAMTVTDELDGTKPPAGAAVQLTFQFSLASLSLTSSFKLGTLSLKSEGNAVQLSLVDSRSPEAPLFVGVSFEVRRVELDENSRCQRLFLSPLDKVHQFAATSSKVQVDHLTLSDRQDQPIEAYAEESIPTKLRLFGTFRLVNLDLDPTLEIESMALEPASHKVFISPDGSIHPAANELPVLFEVLTMQVDASGRLLVVDAAAIVTPLAA